nr:DNA-binding protein [uncultured Desulfobulbus sp.]
MFSLQKVLVHSALTLSLVVPSLATATTPPAPGSEQAVAQAPLDGVALQGKIVETMDSGGYTYLLIDSTQGKVWVAIPQTSVKVGQKVTCGPGMTMPNFTSKTLNRTFKTIIFSPGIEQEGDKAESGSQDGFAAALAAEQKQPQGGSNVMASGASTGSAGAIVPSADVSVIKATGENSYTVGECFDKGKELQGKSVRVRGKVMKVSRMIMGKNWVHLQDGTGNPLKNHHDLVVTTMDDPSEGEIITIAGTLSFERDFGAGYKYDVIVEDATIEK